jgi:hypothetical protein
VNNNVIELNEANFDREGINATQPIGRTTEQAVRERLERLK